MQKEEWEALRDATGPIEVLDWLCGDHLLATTFTSTICVAA